MLRVTFTLGPASRDADTISQLLDTADRFRLNASHLTPDSLHRWLTLLTRIFERKGRLVPVVVDLQGAKMRIGAIADCAFLPAQVTFVHASASTMPGIIPVPHSEFFGALRAGDFLSMNDAKIRVRVLTVSADTIAGEVTRNGPLSSHKGINREEHPIPFEALSENDRRMIEISLPFPFVEYAFSFVHSGREAAAARPHIQARRLTAKIERPEAFEHLQSIASSFDELWLCRGDLGAQAGLRRLGELQRRFTEALPALGKPCVLAGQVLEHMTHFPEPTRSEVVHLHDIERTGYHGIVLSDETAIGKNPLIVAQLLKELHANTGTRTS